MNVRLGAAAVALVATLAAGSSAAAASASRWPAAQERAFVANCKRTSGGMTAYCRCELAWLERRYTYAQIARLYLHDQTRLRRVILRSALACTK